MFGTVKLCNMMVDAAYYTVIQITTCTKSESNVNYGP